MLSPTDKENEKIILSMQMTLDGFSTGPNDEMDYFPPFTNEEMWKDFHQEMWRNLEAADTFILGRRTYQIWEQYWPAAASNPQSSESDKRFSRFADETQKVVISNTLNSVEWKNTKLIKDNIGEEIQKLKQQPGKNLIVAGGATVAQTFASLGLIDEYLIIVHPVILGKGKLLLKDVNVRQKLKLIDTRTFNSGAVELSYSRIS
jgi:dihydrofolate reductase